MTYNTGNSWHTTNITMCPLSRRGYSALQPKLNHNRIFDGNCLTNRTNPNVHLPRENREKLLRQETQRRKKMRDRKVNAEKEKEEQERLRILAKRREMMQRAAIYIRPRRQRDRMFGKSLLPPTRPSLLRKRPFPVLVRPVQLREMLEHAQKRVRTPSLAPREQLTEQVDKDVCRELKAEIRSSRTGSKIPILRKEQGEGTTKFDSSKSCSHSTKQVITEIPVDCSTEEDPTNASQLLGNNLKLESSPNKLAELAVDDESSNVSEFQRQSVNLKQASSHIRTFRQELEKHADLHAFQSSFGYELYGNERNKQVPSSSPGKGRFREYRSIGWGSNSESSEDIENRPEWDNTKKSIQQETQKRITELRRKEYDEMIKIRRKETLLQRHEMLRQEKEIENSLEEINFRLEQVKLPFIQTQRFSSTSRAGGSRCQNKQGSLNGCILNVQPLEEDPNVTSISHGFLPRLS